MRFAFIAAIGIVASACCVGGPEATTGDPPRDDESESVPRIEETAIPPPPPSLAPLEQDPDPRARVALSEHHGCAVRANGRVVCWGNNMFGQLGDGTRTSRDSAREVPRLRDAVEVAVGSRHSCALDVSGRVWCWGAVRGELAEVFGQEDVELTPIRMAGMSRVRRIFADVSNGFAVTERGALYCWGSKYACERESSPAESEETTLLEGVEDVAFVAGGGDSPWIVDRSGRASVLRGRAHHPELGEVVEIARMGSIVTGDESALCVLRRNGSIECRNGDERPLAPLPSFSPAIHLLGTRSMICALRSDRAVACLDGVSESGAPERVTYPGAMRIDGLSGARELAVGWGALACAERAGGEVACWGDEWRYEEAAVEGISGATAIAVGDRRACALVAGRVRCWGEEPADLPAEGAIGVELVTDIPCLRRADRTLSCGESLGEIGDAVEIVAYGEDSLFAVLARGVITRRAMGGGAFQPEDGLQEVRSISSSLQVVCAIAGEHDVWCRGTNALRLHDERAWARAEGAPPANGVATTNVAACALALDGSAWCWDRDHIEPRAIAGATDLETIEASPSGTICGLRRDGTVICWGLEWNLHVYDLAPRVAARDATAIAMGMGSGCALHGDGTVGCWGHRIPSLGSGTGTNNVRARVVAR
jgi:hypothetical protein